MQIKKTLLACGCGLLLTAPAYSVTLHVSVPAGTKACYVSGKFNDWSATDAVPMLPDGAGKFTLDLPDVSTAAMAEGYKYLSGPDWKYVEKDASGGEISNRTTVSSEDKVGSWAALYNPDIVETTINIGGYDRKVRISLPEGYASSGKSYPVVYMVGVQQRYNDAGSDDDCGDDFFGEKSWNMVNTASELQAAGTDGCIMVAMYGFVAENIPFAHPDYAGSGASAEFLTEYIDKVVGYVNSKFRTRNSAASTTIMGADLGGVLSLYAALTHPEVFGRCVAISPMLWINRDEMNTLAAQSSSDSQFLLTYGSKELALIADDVKTFASALSAGATVSEMQGAYHDDESWSKVFPLLYPLFSADTFSLPSTVTLSVPSRERSQRVAADITQSNYDFYYKEGSTGVVPDNSVSFALTDSFILTDGSSTKAQVLIKQIPKTVTNVTVYWNVARREADGSTVFLSDTPKNVAFSAKKTHDSWLRVAVRGEESLDAKAVSSAGFKVFAADENVSMTGTGDYMLTATVPFTGDDKSFTIHYGSVNTQTDMGAITTMYSVSENCTEAVVTYDFATNAVSVQETKWGETIGKVGVTEFSAVPAVTVAGESSEIKVRFTPDSGCTPTLTYTYNYGSAKELTLTAHPDSETWTAVMPDLSAGIYHLQVNAIKGTSVKEDVGEICIKVLSSASGSEQKKLTVNAYDGVDWENVGRYKANFHTHTSQSFDTKFNTDYVVDAYAKAGYKILALTDHDANPYPWQLFPLYNPASGSRSPEELGMIAIPGVELSKDNRNNWNEATGGEFNHHNDFFTGRKGQEFASLRESYAYTQKLGGLQIINHPGQYWSLDKEYTPGEKNSPEWHAENFTMFDSLIGLEVYNQGNRRPNDRILWDQILDITMPTRPVWGYSCDDTHTAEQYFRNYQFMLMDEFSVDALKDAMRNGREYFSYEYTGSGEAKAPRINSIAVDNDANLITIDSDTDEIYWICSTDRKTGASASTRKSTVVGRGKSFDFTGFRGSYVRALLKNNYGETCTQPFGFSSAPVVAVDAVISSDSQGVRMWPNPADALINLTCDEVMRSVAIYSLSGQQLLTATPDNVSTQLETISLSTGIYLVKVNCDSKNYTLKLIKK